jgi:hypothetical protein
VTAYPPLGLTPWDTELKAYLDERETAVLDQAAAHLDEREPDILEEAATQAGVLAASAVLAKAVVRLSTTTGINGKTVGVTTLYTVPGYATSAIITGAVVRCTAATSITVAPSLGITASEGSPGGIFAIVTLTGLTTTGKMWTFASAGLGVAAAAGVNIMADINPGATGTSQTLAVDLLGYLV